jgi:hypothetical protein
MAGRDCKGRKGVEMKRLKSKFNVGQVVRMSTALFNPPNGKNRRARFQKLERKFWCSKFGWAYTTENNWMALEAWISPLTSKEATQ